MRKFFWPRETEAEHASFHRPASLAVRLVAGPLPLKSALRYAIGTAEALRTFHARGRAYAMLQPAGIVIDDTGVHLVPAAPAAITPYFSPEQVQGREIDFRSDIFALGAVLYEMLSGRQAFVAPTKPALRIAILGCDPDPLAGFPPATSKLAMRCLEKAPERRIQRMEILLAELKLQEIMAPRAASESKSGAAPRSPLFS
ncbi:MAG TPA: protein kinase [Bryobacteraceae bacterium]|nr:protein kinase [Bryobacteraceae bacterium]